MMATVCSLSGVQYLWTCRHIGVNSAGNIDPPPSGTGAADRSAVEWFKIRLSPSVEIAATDRIYDNSATTPKFYYMPSLAVNANGDMALGFSGSSANAYIGAYYAGIMNGGNSVIPPLQYFSGKDWYQGAIGGPNAGTFVWGDYSYTSADPDGSTFWTIQQYAEVRYSTSQNAWGTRIGVISPF